MNRVTFSVIIPTYNRADALKRCLDSLVIQTFTDFEVIVCDDGSTDHTRDVAEAYRRKLDIRYEFEENWGGPAKPRNRGIALAQGEWCCFLDSDDYWDANKLSEMIKYVPEYSVLYHPLRMIGANGSVLAEMKCRQINSMNGGRDLLINLNTIPTSSACVKLALLKSVGGFSLKKDIIGLEDYDLWIRLGLAGARFQNINQVLGSYFVGDNDNITFEDERQILRFEKLYEPYISDPGFLALKSRIWASFNFHKGRIIQDGKLKGRYRKHLYIALRNGSLRVRLMAMKRLLKF